MITSTHTLFLKPGKVDGSHSNGGSSRSNRTTGREWALALALPLWLLGSQGAGLSLVVAWRVEVVVEVALVVAVAAAVVTVVETSMQLYSSELLPGRSSKCSGPPAPLDAMTGRVQQPLTSIGSLQDLRG